MPHRAARVEVLDAMAQRRAVEKLHDDARLREKASSSGREAFLDRYNWESTSGELVELYDSLERAGGGKR